MKMSEQGKGLFFVILSGFLWGIAGCISKILLNGGGTPILLIFSRNIFGVACLGAFMYFFNKKMFHIDKCDIKPLIVCCIVLFIYSAAYFFSIYFMNVSIAVVLLYMYPTFVAVASVFLYKERLTWQVTTALALTLLGMALSVNLFTEGLGLVTVPGFCLSIFAAIGAAGYCIYCKKLSGKYHSFTINFYGLLFTVFAYGVITLLSDPAPLSKPELAAALGAAVPYIGGFLTYAIGVKYLRPSYASIFGTTEALFNVLLAAIILGEIITGSQLIGMVFIIGAIVMLELTTKNKPENS